MKKLPLIMVLSCLSVYPMAVTATGIPTFDLGSITQTIIESTKRAAEAKKMLDQAKEEFQQQVKFAEDMKKRLEGFTDFKSGFDTMSAYMQDNLSDFASRDVSDLRSQYKLEDSNDDTFVLEKIKFYDESNKKLTRQAKKLDEFRQKFSNAKTPQEKSDLTNQLLSAQLAMDIQLKQYDLAERRLEQDQQARARKADEDWIKKHL